MSESKPTVKAEKVAPGKKETAAKSQSTENNQMLVIAVAVIAVLVLIGCGCCCCGGTILMR